MRVCRAVKVVRRLAVLLPCLGVVTLISTGMSAASTWSAKPIRANLDISHVAEMQSAVFPRLKNGPIAPVSEKTGYWLVASDGGIFTFGDAGYYGSTGSIALNKPIVGMAPTPDGKGYWLVASDGGIFTFGDAGYYGSTGSIALNKPIVGMAPTPDGKGYWLVASDGGIFTFGDAGYYGSTGSIALNKPIVGMAPTPDGKGYWLVASDGGIFTFGDAGYYGSTGSIALNKPIVGMAPTPDGKGYWLVASDGGIFTFGDAGYYGSEPGEGIAVSNAVGIESTPSGGGYWVAGHDGRVSAFGDASSQGSMLGQTLNQPIVGFASVPVPIPVTAPLVSITTISLPNATTGSPYSTSLKASGGTPPYVWSITSGSLPQGLSVSPAGAITGTPSVQGNSTFSVAVTDNSIPTVQVASAILSIEVSETPVPFTNSDNWSGYVLGNGPFTLAQGTFTVPSLVEGTPEGEETAEWVGIGGVGSNTQLIQAGVSETPDSRTPNAIFVFPWWEVYPTDSISIVINSVVVSAGDEVTVIISQLSGSDWEISLTDDSNGQNFTTNQPFTGTQATAEWIVEAPGNYLNDSQTVPLAPYSPNITFSELLMTPRSTTVEDWNMIQGGNVVSTPSAFTSKGFNVAYGSVAPAPP